MTPSHCPICQRPAEDIHNFGHAFVDGRPCPEACTCVPSHVSMEEHRRAMAAVEASGEAIMAAERRAGPTPRIPPGSGNSRTRLHDSGKNSTTGTRMELVYPDRITEEVIEVCQHLAKVCELGGRSWAALVLVEFADHYAKGEKRWKP